MLREDAARIIQEGISLSLSIFKVLFIVNLFDNSGLSTDSSLYKAIHIRLSFGFAKSKGGSQVLTKRPLEVILRVTTKNITNFIVPEKLTVR